MLNFLKEKIAKVGGSNLTKYNFIREYLQLLILKIINDKRYFNNLAFVGGTALRILYDLNRFSEDLDFCLIDKKRYSFADMMKAIETEIKLNNLNVEINYKSSKTVAAGLVKFPELLYELGLSPHKTQKLSIKIEVDLNPPIGYNTELTMVSKEFLFAINHYDLPSLYAGKLHALLCRKYTKGRDYYDLLWYLGKKVEPNYLLLEQAILQTEKTKIHIDKDKLKELLRKRINDADFNKVSAELSPFLVDASEIRYFNKEFFLKLFA